MNGPVAGGRGAWAPAVVALLPLLILWEAVGRADVALFIPPLSQVVLTWWKLAADGTLWKAMATSLVALLKGYGLALLVGIPLGTAMGRFRAIQYFCDPYVNMLTSAPLSALVPILIALFGLRDTVVTATVFLFAVSVMIVNSMAGVKGIDRSVLEMARAFGATPVQFFAKILLPAALPAILVGAHLGAMQAVKGMVVGEMLISLVGLGERLVYYGNTFLILHLYAVILTVVVMALLAAQLVHLADRALIRWK